MICAQMILHFKPSESYGKYIRLLMSMMVLAQLVVPALSIFGKNGEDIFQGKIAFYDNALKEQMDEISITCVTAEKMLETLTMEEIKTRLNNAKQEETQEEEREETGQEDASETAPGQVTQPEEITIDRIEVSAGD